MAQPGALFSLMAAVALLACLTATAEAMAAPSILTVDTKTSQIKDEHGRVRIYHGQNVVYKVLSRTARRGRERKSERRKCG